MLYLLVAAETPAWALPVVAAGGPGARGGPGDQGAQEAPADHATKTKSR